jgi:hypothetical protein
MIDWPDDADDSAQQALDLFKKTSLAAELEDDAGRWRFAAYARSPSPPARMILRSDGGATRVFTLEPTGFWVEKGADRAA